jgi:hypothetical protein
MTVRQSLFYVTLALSTVRGVQLVTYRLHATSAEQAVQRAHRFAGDAMLVLHVGDPIVEVAKGDPESVRSLVR